MSLRNPSKESILDERSRFDNFCSFATARAKGALSQWVRGPGIKKEPSSGTP
jgi:hypothetical protein